MAVVSSLVSELGHSCSRCHSSIMTTLLSTIRSSMALLPTIWLTDPFFQENYCRHLESG